MLTDLRATRLLCLALLFTSTLSRQAVAQWFIGLEIGSERFWGGSLETTPDQRSFRPYRPTTFSAAVERRSGSLGAALRLRYTDASMALEGSEAVVAVKGVFTVISVSAEISYGIITLGQNQLLLHAGPVVEHWSLVDEDSRFRVGAQGAVGLNIPLGGRMAMTLLADAAVVGSPFEQDELDPTYDLRALWRRGFAAGLRYRL
ncbi:MAG TPA: hypothetical protein VFZ87_05145 [Gemmatimonadales bacterium]